MPRPRLSKGPTEPRPVAARLAGLEPIDIDESVMDLFISLDGLLILIEGEIGHTIMEPA